MQIIELKKKNIKLIADEGKTIQSKAMHFDEECGEDVPDVVGEIVYLGKNDVAENYEEIEKEEF